MKLAIVATHPIQYYAPWFRLLAAHRDLDLKVFYLWDFGITPRHDPGFQREILWDIPLLEGYAHEFVPNTASHPGTSHFRGLRNPGLPGRLRDWSPDALLLMGYSWDAFLRLILFWDQQLCPLLFRGDSHQLVPPTGIRARLRESAARFLFSRISSFLYCGTANRDYFRHRGVADDRLFFCPHGVDQERFRPDAGVLKDAQTWRLSLGIPPENRVILFAGKFEQKKRPLDLLHAFRKSPRDKATLLFVGSGALGAELERQAAGDSRIIIHPPENQSFMPRVYQAADLFVLPSAGPGETWGLAVQEALACGIPAVVSSHVGCAADLLRPGKNGLIFPAGSVTELDHALTHSLAPGVLESWKPNCLLSLENHNYHRAVQSLLAALGLPDRKDRP